MLIDTHAHLYAEEFDNDRETMITRAFERGVTKLFLPNIDASSIPGMLDLAGKYPGKCFPMMGLHPCYVTENYQAELDMVESWLKKMSEPDSVRFYAVGEIGIDLYWDKTFFAEQQDAFRRQIGLAKEYGLPIVIHTRSSFDECYTIVKELNDNSLTGIFHCFSGNEEEALKVIELGGFKLGIGGVLTFKNSGLDKVVAGIDLKHLVLETDAPYLAPVPHRGKRNESAYISIVAEKLASIKGITPAEVAKVTSENAMEVFGIERI